LKKIDNIALLIDTDNSSHKKIDLILSEIAKYGTVTIRRAYGNFASEYIKGWSSVLHEHAIKPIQQFDYTKGKNATDIAMTIDAMDLIYSNKIDAFCVVSSDSDFTPLVMRILAEGKKVYGFGYKKTPKPFVNACSNFLYLENLEEERKETKKAQTKEFKNSNKLLDDVKLMNLLRNAISITEDNEGWASIAQIGQNISNQTSFDSRNYGFKKLSDLLKATDMFDMKKDNKNNQYYVRLR
jgi:uncharacterized protein (TIGR00288 family)